MAFHRNENKNTRKPADAQTSRVEDEQDFEQPVLRTLASVQRLTGPSNSRSARERTFFKTYQDWLEENKVDEKQSATRLLPVTGAMAGRSDSNSIAIVVTNIGDDVFWHGLIFESEEVTVETFNNRRDRDYDDRRDRRDRRDDRIKEYVFLSDRLSNESVKVYGEWVATQVKCSGEIIFSDFTIVPVEADLKDLSVLDSYLRNSEESNIVASGQDPAFNANRLDGGYLEGTLTFNDSERDDVCPITSLPIRSDFQTTIVRKPGGRSNRPEIRYVGSENHTEERTVVSVDGFVNLRVVAGSSPRRNRRQEIDYSFVQPEVIATDINTLNSYGDGIIERYAAGLASLISLRDGDAWRRLYMPSVNSKKNKLTDIVRMSMIPSDEWPKDIKDADELQDAAEDFLDLIVPEDAGVEFAVLVRENGLGYAGGKLLIDMSAGDRNDGAILAYEDFVDALDVLTAKRFSQIYKPECPSDIVVAAVRMPWGYFNDHRMRPIEDVDTLYLAAQADAISPETMDDWIEATAPSDRDLGYEEGMNALVNGYTEASGNFRIKGVATKVTLNPEFLIALYDAMIDRDSGLEFEMSTNSRRGYNHGRKRSTRRESYGMVDNPMRGRGRDPHNGTSRGGYTRSRRMR